MNDIAKKQSKSGNSLAQAGNDVDLGDIIGLKPLSKKHSNEKNSFGPKQNPESNNKSMDLASIVGLKPPANFDNGDNKYRLNEQKKSENKISDKNTSKITIQSAKPRHHKKGEPILWLLYPELYPHVVEVFRHLKTKIAALESKRNKQLKTLLITGPHEKCGVSTVAFNLALTLSFDMIDKQILLVDINISAPSLHSTFGYPINPGLMDYLFGIRPLDDIILPSDYPNLHLIPSGSIDFLTVVPFDLAEFSHFLDDVKEQYDFILLDSAPLLKSSQTLSLSSKTDGVIIVAEANKTRWQVIADLKNQLDNNGANLIGGFLNKRRFPIPKWLYRWI
ncbi:CpsD/CapB family tyrosine-protein kinase [Desulfococcaceae bacterium HSG7]|nr:CpsD/CapB family tyrosine-protein kinase [Desulfococcaceae bacterium HSG7]